MATKKTKTMQIVAASKGGIAVLEKFQQTTKTRAAEAAAKLRLALLSPEDREHLARFEAMRTILRYRVISVALRYQVGAYIVGRPGTGKTWTVLEVLSALEALKEYNVSHTLRNAKLTAPGLWKLLRDFRESTVVLDDVGTKLAERAAQMILMAALNGRPGEPRKVTYTTGEADGRGDFDFLGGIIAISNLPLRRDPLADAIASRVPLLEFEPDDHMIAAFMRFEALKGYRTVPAAEAMEVVEFLIAASRDGEHRLDLRAMVKGLGDYELCRHGHAKCDWRDLVRSSLRKLAAADAASPATRAEKRDRLLEVAAAINAKYPDRRQRTEREVEWAAQTGLSADQLYRYLAQVKGPRAA